MKRFLFFTSAVLVLILAVSAFGSQPLNKRRADSVGLVHGGAVNPAKADRDTVLVLGPWESGAAYNGQFQTADGFASWNGWTHEDLTHYQTYRWTVSEFNAETLGMSPQSGNLAAWCGFPYVACDEEDVEGGYGNYWNETIEWRTTVANPAARTDVDLSFWMNWDTEKNFDYVYVMYINENGPRELDSLDDQGFNENLTYSFSYTGEDYAGDLGDEIIIQFVFISDSGFADDDCLYASAGACQIDDIEIQFNDAVVSFTDFEDGTFGEWSPTLISEYVGDFAMLRNNLGDIDPCATNTTFQATFIDDGVVVPGTGGMVGINWVYGPGGFIVNCEGGLAGPEFYINNSVTSPSMTWPDPNYDGCYFHFDGYTHEDLDRDAPGIYYTWGIRSTPSTNPDDIVYSGFRDRNFVYYSDPLYIRNGDDVTDLMMMDRKFVQVRMSVIEYGYVWNYTGRDGYPAPYFDNARVAAYPYFGPAMTTRQIDLANDVFPEIGTIDLINLGANSCRFDMATNIAPQQDKRNDPGDSVTIVCTAVRNGSVLNGDPQLRWKMKANPLFDPYRTSEFGTAREGVAYGWSCGTDNFAFDLPDTGFLFPGDVLHYYFFAEDLVGGSDVGASIMPADTTGFSEFHVPMGYNSAFTVHALPSIKETSPGYFTQPTILFWNDQAYYGGENEWEFALSNLGFVEGETYDTFYTNGPSSGVGNGLGGRAGSVQTIAGYEDMLYTSGNLSVNTISNGDYKNDSSPDVQLMDNWLLSGDKDLFMTGDDLVHDLLNNGGPLTQAFAIDHLGVTYEDQDLRPLIQNQYAPVVKATPANPIFATVTEWVAYGGCFAYNTFDAVEVDGVGQRIAEFTDSSGNMGAFPYSAATLCDSPLGNGSRVLSLPYDLMFVYTNPDEATKSPSPVSARTRLLSDVLMYFGQPGGGPAVDTDVPVSNRFAIHNQPNPFNPSTTIKFNMPKAGQLKVEIFNVRGGLVRTLIDGHQTAGPGEALWDGTDDKGAAVSAGVYFYKAQHAKGSQFGKMALVK